MSNTLNNPLPDGFIDELLDQLPDSTRLHLVKHVCNLNTVPPHQAPHSKAHSHHPKTTSKIKNLQDNSHKLQRLIFTNITRIGRQFLSKSGHNLPHILLLCRLITKSYLCNLVELDLQLDARLIWNNNHACDGDALAELNNLLPSILSSLPRLQSFTLPRIDYGQHKSLFFSLPGLFPADRSSHLEKLCLSRGDLNKAHFKILALHSNYIFPSLTHLDLSFTYFGETDHDTDNDNDDTNDPHSSMHYMLQWIEQSMPKLAHLSLSRCRLAAPHITTDFANSPILSRLVSLDLSCNSDVGAKGWETLFTSSQFTNSQRQDCLEDLGQPPGYHTTKLKTLKLDDNPSIQSVIPLLTQNCPCLTNLTTLSLNDCNLDDSSIQSICDLKWADGLESLSLRFNIKLTTDAIRMIADCEGMRNLTSLDLDGRRGRFALDLLRHMTQSHHVSKLTKIRIDLVGMSYNQSVDQALFDFFHSPKTSALTELFLHCDTIPQSVMKSILLSPTLSNLEYVEVFDYNENEHRTNEWIDAFVQSPNRLKLHTLLTQCHLTDSNILSISQTPYLSNLRYLSLSRNLALTDDSVMYLAQSEGIHLKRLDLSYNPLLTPLVFHHLAQSPQILSRLKKISISGFPLILQEHNDILAKAGWFDGQIN